MESSASFDEAGLLSRLSFGYLTDFLGEASQRGGIDRSCVPPAEARLQAAPAAAMLARCVDTELQRQHVTDDDDDDDDDDDAAALLKNRAAQRPQQKRHRRRKDDNDGSKENKEEEEETMRARMWAMARALVRTAQTELCGCALGYVFTLLATISSPMILSLLIDAVSRLASDDEDGGSLTAVGGWSVLLFVLLLAQAVAYQNTRLFGRKSHMRLAAAMRGQLLSKCMQSGSLDKASVLSLLSVDIETVAGVWYFNEIWYVPVYVLVTFGQLYWLLGVAGFVPLILIVLVVPVNWKLGAVFDDANAKRMQEQDERMRLLSDVLTGILPCKLFVLEEWSQRAVAAVRAREEAQVRRYNTALAGCFSVANSCGAMFSLATFLVYFGLLGHSFRAALVFPAIALLNQITWPLLDLPYSVGQVIQARESLRRLCRFLFGNKSLSPPPRRSRHSISKHSININIDHDDSDMDHLNINLNDDQINDSDADHLNTNLKDDQINDNVVIGMQSASFAWPEAVSISNDDDGDKTASRGDGGCALRDVSIAVKQGQFIGLVGRVGQGKSSLLAAIAGGLHCTDGEFWLRDDQCKVAYVGQTPWLINATLKENVIFPDTPDSYDEARYQRALDASALLHDLASLPGGDNSLLGDRGITLSGGQRARVTVARAVYAQADVYLLDDPLSAVDKHVGRHLFERCFVGELAGRTRLLATHHLHLLPQLDEIWLLDGGRIVQRGTYAQLVQRGVQFDSIADDSDNGVATLNDFDSPLTASPFRTLGPSPLHDSADSKAAPVPPAPPPPATPTVADEADDDAPRHSGQVRWSVYTRYLSYFPSRLYLAATFLCAVMAETASTLSSTVLLLWSLNGDNSLQSLTHWLAAFTALNLLDAVTAFASRFLLFNGGVVAASNIHAALLRRVLHAPMSFFYRTPIGNVLTRFSKDQTSIDTEIPEMTSGLMMTSIFCAATIIVCVVSSPFFIVALLLLGWLFLRQMNVVRPVTRDAGRITSSLMSPITSLFGEVVEGTTELRCYGMSGAFEQLLHRRSSAHTAAFVLQDTSMCWMSLRTSFITALFTLCLSLSSVLLLLLPPGLAGYLLPLAGMAVALSISLANAVSWLMWNFAYLESEITKVERVLDTIDIDVEQSTAGGRPTAALPPGWPSRGKIELRNVSAAYRPDLPPALRGVSVTLPAGRKVGIVGRTGSGKSTLVACLFRILELSAGRILLDGVDIAAVPLAELRSRIAVIPQTPFLMSGTLRHNFECFASLDDHRIWSVLDAVGMKAFFEAQPQRLDFRLEHGGQNLSVGQRQLLCLARVLLLNKPSVLVMDEATANLDPDSDENLQRAIRRQFAGCTVVTIAHRLQTVIDYDMIVVVDAGAVVETGRPAQLAAKDPTLPDAYFARLLADSNE